MRPMISWRRRNKIITRAARVAVWRDGSLVIRVFLLTKHATPLPQAPVVVGVWLRLRDAKATAERQVPGYLWTYNQAAGTWAYPTLVSRESPPQGSDVRYMIRRYDLCRISWAGLLVSTIFILAGLATIVQYS